MNELRWLGLLVFLLLWSACQQKTTAPMIESENVAFIGTYTQKEGHVDGKGAGILAYKTGPAASDWQLLNSFSDIINPSYLCLSTTKNIIYAVSEQGPNAPAPASVIKVIQYDPDTYVMSELQSISAKGDAPCYISTDRESKNLFVANYVSGNVVQYRIKADGTLEEGKATAHQGKGPHPRQEAPHAHYIKQHPTKDDIYAVDLGTDEVIRYLSEEDGLEKLAADQLAPGNGPRHMDWHPNGKIFFVLNELSGTVEARPLGTQSGLSPQSISLLNDERTYAGGADIHISEDGAFIYVSLRGDFNEIVVLQVDQKNYGMREIQRIGAGGRTPRNFAISPNEDYLAVASQDEDRIVLFRRDATSGKLSRAAAQNNIIKVNTPVCIVWK